MIEFSLIIPVYNRPDEVKELLESLSIQTFKDFEVIIAEDGSDKKCDTIVNSYINRLNIKYFFKKNSGPGLTRNYGSDRADGNYFLFFDSDCIIPEDYMEKLNRFLSHDFVDAFGGSDTAHHSFTNTQKAINYSMTSFITTGGIRGGKKQLNKFQPRSFNMGFSKEVFKKTGGFSNIHPGEDPDLSLKIMQNGFKVRLINDLYVYHKRRINFAKFITQVYKFGVVRVILCKWHTKTFKLIFALPSLFLTGTLLLILLSISLNKLFLLPLGLFILIIFIDSLLKNRNLNVAFFSIIASFIQLTGYGIGFIFALWKIVVLQKNEEKAFPGFFFSR
ncbi:MAG: glycosyltransferase [Bacteroidota bacterium]